MSLLWTVPNKARFGGVSVESHIKLEDSMARFEAMYGAVTEDADMALKCASADPSQYNKRVAFRVAFATIDGLVFLLKDQALARINAGHIFASNAEIALLRDETYNLDRGGRVVTSRRPLRLSENLLFAWTMYFRGYPDFRIYPDDDGWRCFVSSLGVRNRITHPRSHEDLELSDKEINELRAGYQCVLATFHRNLAGAFLWSRKDIYLKISKQLSQETLRWLDEIIKQEIVASATTFFSENDLLLVQMEISGERLRELQSHNLVRIEDGQFWLTSKCIRYLGGTRESAKSN